MSANTKLLIAVVCTSVVQGLCVRAVSADVLGVTGDATARVVQLDQGTEVQTDFSRDAVPAINATLPAVAEALLEESTTEGDTLALGRVRSILLEPNLSGIGNPSDVGIDLGAFADDSSTSWQVNGQVAETRTIVISAREAGGNLRVGSRETFRSRVLLSGIMLISSKSEMTDLSGALVNLRVVVLQRFPDEEGHEPVSVLSGSVSLAGGTNGTVHVDQAGGCFEGLSLPIIEFPSVLPELPVVRALVFTGLQLPYEYSAVVGRSFVLELQVTVDLETIPGGMGAGAAFGLPPEGLASVFAKTKGMETVGQRLAAMIAEKVDTTGKAYLEAEQATTSVFPLLPACGVSAPFAAAVTAVCLIGTNVRRRRPKLARRLPESVKIEPTGERSKDRRFIRR